MTTVSYQQVDLNPSGWVQQFLAANNIQSVSPQQDKITALYTLHSHKMLSPLTLRDIFSMSDELAKIIAQANGFENTDPRINRLSTLIILINLGAATDDVRSLVSNPAFNSTFLMNDSDLIALLSSRGITIYDKSPASLILSALNNKPLSPIRVKPASPIRVHPNPKICQACNAFIYAGDECGLCDAEDYEPSEILEETQADFHGYIDYDEYENQRNYDSYEDY